MFTVFTRKKLGFSIQCCKTKTKVITVTIKTEADNLKNQSELAANTCRWLKARENVCEQVTIGLVLLLRIFSQSQKIAVQNQSNRANLLSTLNGKPLNCFIVHLHIKI